MLGLSWGRNEIVAKSQDGPRTLQDASKSASGALKDPSSNAKELSRAAKKSPRAPRDAPGVDFHRLKWFEAFIGHIFGNVWIEDSLATCLTMYASKYSLATVHF